MWPESLQIHFFANQEINFKPSQRHNNYIYKSKDDSAWQLNQVGSNGPRQNIPYFTAAHFSIFEVVELR